MLHYFLKALLFGNIQMQINAHIFLVFVACLQSIEYVLNGFSTNLFITLLSQLCLMLLFLVFKHLFFQPHLLGHIRECVLFVLDVQGH